MGRWIYALVARLRAIVLAPRAERDLDDELSFHLAMQARANVRSGMSDDEATRRARLALGGVEQVKERSRAVRPLRWAHDFMRDIRYAQRSLRRAPGFTTVALLTLALGIGANTAIFSVLNTYLFRALPYPEPDRLVKVFRTSIHSDSWPHSPANLLEVRNENTALDYVVPMNYVRPTLIHGDAAAESLTGLAVSSDFFPALGVAPARGRVFTAAEDQPGVQVVVLSHAFWQRRFGGDAAIVGRKIRLNGEDTEIIGVMPPGFEHPLLWGSIDLWRPIAFTPQQRQNRDGNYLQAFGRLKGGVSLAEAQRGLVALFDGISKEHASNQNESLRIAPLQESMSDDVVRRVMWFTFGLAGFVLLIACANLANLQLVRATARVREHSVRAALGAARFRLVRQSLTESMFVAIVGGALSVVVAIAGARFIGARLFEDLPGAAVALDWRVFGFALLCSVATGVAFGTFPAWLASRTNVNNALKDDPRGSTGGSHLRLRHALIVGEVAFALILLTGAGLFLRGLQRFIDIDPGWRVDGLLMAQVNLIGGGTYSVPSKRMAFFEQLEARLRTLPGVVDVSLAASQPALGFGSSGPVIVEGQPEPAPGTAPEVFFEPVSLKYFETLGVRLIEGRHFTSADIANFPQVAIINETMARRLWPKSSPLGRRFAMQGDMPAWLEVVGVVNDVGFPANVSETYTKLQAFRPLAQSPPANLSIALRTSVPPESLTEGLRRAVADVDPTRPVARVRTARAQVQQGLGRLSLLGTLLGAFAALGLALAIIGIYGVIAYTVAQRTNELGLRMALGADARDVLWLVLSTGALLIVVGGVVGAGGGYAVARLLAAAIPMLPTYDPTTLTIIVLATIVVALAACFVPARRASRMDPWVALRRES